MQHHRIWWLVPQNVGKRKERDLPVLVGGYMKDAYKSHGRGAEAIPVVGAHLKLGTAKNEVGHDC